MAENFRVALPSGESFTAERGENLLAAAQRAHWLIRYGCRNGNCEACAARLQSGYVEQSNRMIDAAQGEQSILLCLAHAHGDLQIELPGNPLHGSAEHAQRSYAQLQAIETLNDGAYALRFFLPAGKKLSLYAGQLVSVEAEPMIFAEIGVDALHGRELTVIADTLPSIAIGARVHLRYPLGFAYRVAAATAPIFLLYEAATSARATRMLQWLDAKAIDMTQPLSLRDESAQIFALAQTEATVRDWYAQLLAAGVRFTEMRSDFVILQPWRVCRQDDNGNRFVMARHLDEIAARVQAKLFAERGHKQLYWAEPDHPD